MLITLDQLKTSLQAMKNYVIGLVPTKVSELQNDSGYLTTETDPTVPSWAKAQTKPSYTADEVGAASVNIVADDYDSSSMYVVGDMVIYDGLLYQCICQIDSESWNPAHWRQVTVDDEIEQSNRKISYNKTTAESAYLHKSQSGSLVHIMDGADNVPLQNISVNINPIQSGSGDPSSSNIRPIYGWDGTKVYSSIVPPIRFIPLNNSSWESEGVTLKYLGNGTYEVGEIQEGVTTIFNVDIEPFTFSSNYNMLIANSTIRHSVGQFDFVFSLRNGDGGKANFAAEYKNDLNDFVVVFDSSQLLNIEITKVRIIISHSMSGAKFTPMLLNKSFQSFVEWGDIAGSVYGGNMHLTTGTLTSQWACIDSYNGEELPGEWISDRDVYVSGTTPTTGAQVVYRLTEPQIYKLEVKFPVRNNYLENYIWALTGDISFTYAIDQQTSFDAKMPNVTFGTKTTLVDTTTLSFSKDGDNDWYCTAENPIQGFVKADFVNDAIYTVTWDGIEYSGLFVQLHENNTYDSETNKITGWYDWSGIGNTEILNYHNYYETDAPFCIAYDFHRNEAEIQIFTLSTEASHTIKIEKTSYTKTLTPIQYYTDTYKGRSPISWGKGELSIVEGGGTKADGDASHSEGGATIANGVASHSEGGATIADANYSHAEGYITIASGNASHSEGYGAESTGSESHAEGIYSIASGNFGSHAEGNRTEASGSYGSHSEGYYTVASGNISHAEGGYTTASGIYSHAQNANTTASGITSSASGNNTIANHRSQYVFGEYNVIDTSEAESSQKGNYIEIVGNGTRDSRSNARTLDWSGNEVLAGKLTVGSAPTNNMDVATKQYVDNSQIDVQINGTSITNNGVANIPVAGVNTLGVAKVNQDYGIMLYNNILAISAPADIRIKTGGDLVAPIVAAKQHMSTFYGLAKAAGDTTQASSENAVGIYTTEAKTAIKNMLGVAVDDVQVNGSSILNNGVANVPIASADNFGAVRIGSGIQVQTGNSLGKIAIYKADEHLIKAGEEAYKPIVPQRQHLSTFYGLAKAAGADMASSNNAVGTYTDAAKTAIKNMIGVPDTLGVGTAITASADLNSYTTSGIYSADSTVISSVTHAPTTTTPYKLIVESTGANTIKQTITTTDGSTYIRTGDSSTSSWVFSNWKMDISDVQINGSSILSNGVANIPIAAYQVLGAVSTNGDYGISASAAGRLSINSASDALIKEGVQIYRPIVSANQHTSVFYGLAKAAGQDMASSDNAVGTYTSAAKTAIQSMLGISDGYVTKDSIDYAGITARSYTTKFGGEFTVTTATSQDYISPYARASVTGRINKENLHRVTVNGTEYILQTRLWFDDSSSLKTYEYLGNLGLYISNVSGVPDGTDNVPFVIISDLNDSSSIDVLTSTAGTYTILVEQINNTQKRLPISLIYGDSYAPILKNNNSGTYNGFSIGVNELTNKRATFAFGYGNRISNEFNFAFGNKNKLSGNTNIVFGRNNTVAGNNNYVFGDSITISSTTADALAFGYKTTANCNNMVAMGKQNVPANTSFPDWQNSTTYKVGDMVNAAWPPAPKMTWICKINHTSSSSMTFQQDFSRLSQEHGSPPWAPAPSNGDTAFVVGNGSMNTNSNAFKIDFAGNGFFGADIYVGCNADSSGGTRLPHDIQINGTSIVSNGVANVPVAAADTYGVVKVNSSSGIQFDSEGALTIKRAVDAYDIKRSNDGYRFIPTYSQHIGVFYGLAKAAGSSMASSNNPVGTYTDAAKNAIKTMLGTTEEANQVFNISGTDPTITGLANVRYMCGEVYTLSITPPATGTIDVVFTSGSSPTVLTLPNTVIMPDWWAGIETNRTYEIIITDGVYVGVMSWPTTA